MNLKEKLVKIVGTKRVIDDPAKMVPFIKGESLEPLKMPNCVVSVKDAKEAAKVVKLANKSITPVIPSSSGTHARSIIPAQGGIILDMSKMKTIHDIDKRNRKVRIEPGLTWGELNSKLKRHKMMVYNPLFPRSDSSVITTLLEREPRLNTRFEYGEQILALEMIWPTGEIFKTGTASFKKYPKGLGSGDYPYGPGPIDPLRLLQGAQGTMGIVTWANVKIEHKPKADKTFCMPFKKFDDMIEAIFAIQRKRIGFECLALDNLNLACILAKDMADDFERLRKTLPPWSLIIILTGPQYFPEEKIAYEEEALHIIRNTVFPGSKVLDIVPGFGSTHVLPDILRSPWPKKEVYWKSRLKGACQDLIFMTIMDKVPEFIAEVKKVAGNNGVDPDALGIYIQPVDFASSAHVEFNFFYNPEDAKEKAKVANAYKESIEAALKLEAHFTRPYGKVTSDLVYERASSYTGMLKKTKAALDPNNVMNPGALCF